jgi:hypothetical protein
MKKLLIVLLVLLVLGGAYFAWVKYSPDKFSDGYYLVPSDAVMVVETEDPVKSWQAFSSGNIWQGIKTFPPFAEITKNADMMDDIIKSNQQVFSMLGQRHLLISIHMTKARDYDFVYYADMREASKSGMVKASLTSLITQFDYTHTVRTFNNVEVNEYFDPKTRDVLSICFVSNYLVCSYNKGLVDKVISASQLPQTQLGTDARFTEVNRLTSAKGLCRIMINYKTFHQYLGVYMDDVSDIKGLFTSMFYTGLDCQVENDMILADGYSMVNDSLSSFLQALSVSGKSASDAEKVFSDKASFFLSMGFTDFNTFYGNLEKVLQLDPVSYDEQQKGIRKVEKLLGINVEKNLFNWMGSEVAIAQYETDLLIGNKVRSIVAIRATDISLAKENLAMIEKQVGKRTPVKFNGVTYNGYEIKYLEVKGLFRSFLGKLFSKIDKPYYTIMDDYVVLSDDPKTLLVTIDDFIAQKTLANKQEYRDFRAKFSDKTSVMAYISPNHHFANFKGLLNPESWVSSQKHQQYIRSFNHVGLSLSGDGDRMRTVFGTLYQPWVKLEMVVDTSDVDTDTLSSLELFYIRNFRNNMNTTYYENGNPKTSVELDGTVMDGVYLDYYESGVIKTKGRYKKGVKDGTWRYYKPNGDFDFKEKYIDGAVKKPNLLEKIFGHVPELLLYRLHETSLSC